MTATHPTRTPAPTVPPRTRTVTPGPTDTRTPTCDPPEFFDPFLNICRLPDEPPTTPPPGPYPDGT
jgi:hypothetical protein